MTPSPRSGRPLLSNYTRAALLLALAATPLAAQEPTILFGRVIEDGSGTPIGTVDVRLTTQARQLVVRAFSDEQGAFRMEVPDSGTYRLDVSRVGYTPVSTDSLPLAQADEVQLEIRLNPRAIALEAVTVVARRSLTPMRITQFRERAEENRKLGRGRIYTREDIDRIRPNSPHQILDTIPWTNCRPTVLLDGLPQEGRMSGLPYDLIEGIEIYRGINQIPPEYYRYGMCGLAMVWTRHDPPGMRPFSWLRLAVAGAVVVVIGLLMQ